MDVQHLEAIGRPISQPLFIDSALRDKIAFPCPAEYEVVFDPPMHNVVGLEILDGSIPSSMFNVDVHNNTLALRFRTGGSGTSDGLLALLGDMRNCARLAAVLADSADKHRVRVVAASVARAPALAAADAQADAARAAGSTLTLAFAGSSTIAPIPAASVSALSPGEPVPVCAGVRVWRSATGAALWAYAVAPADSRSVALAPDGRAAVLLRQDGWPDALAACALDILLSLPLADAAVRVERSPLTSEPEALRAVACFAAGQAEFDALAAHAEHDFTAYNVRLPPGDHSPEVLLQVLREVVPTYSPTGVASDSTPIFTVQTNNAAEPDSFSRDRRLLFRARDMLWIDAARSSVAPVLGFSQPTGYPPEEAGATHVAVPAPGDNRFSFGSVLRSSGLHELVAPGVVNLTGERFVVLRCPQIEDHLGQTPARARFSAGLGIFKMYDTPLAHLRFDFSALQGREIHPIGKLAKIRLRFERVGGELYDFKGVDHHLFISVRILAPRPVVGLVEPERRVNPDYDPDVTRFSAAYYADDLDESSTEDDETVLLNAEHRRRYELARARARRALPAPSALARPRPGAEPRAGWPV